MKMCSIASGSSGNCIYIGTEATHLLVDVGISCKKTVEGLNQLGLKGQDIDGILITHEHADHINGLGVMSRKFGIPIYATPGTIKAIKGIKSLGAIDEELFHEVNADEKMIVKDITVNPMMQHSLWHIASSTAVVKWQWSQTLEPMMNTQWRV